MKLYKAILHTAQKLRGNIEAQGEVWDLAEIRISNLLKYYEALDGIEAIVAPGMGDDTYSILGAATEAYRDNFKKAVYYSEQDPLYGTYIDKWEDFDRDWEAGECCADGVLHLKNELV